MVEVDVASSLATQVATVTTLLKTIALDNGALNGIANQMNAMNQVQLSAASNATILMYDMCPHNPQSMCYVQNNLFGLKEPP